MTTLLVLAAMLGQSPDYAATAALALARAARERPVSVVANPDPYTALRDKVRAGATYTVYVRQNPPQDAANAVRLESFDGQTSGVYRCFLHTDGEPSYERVDAVPVAVVPAVQTVVVPLGSHAHYDRNGNIVIHGNENWGKPHPGLNTKRIAEGGKAVTGTFAAPSTPAKPRRVYENGNWYDVYPDGSRVLCEL